MTSPASIDREPVGGIEEPRLSRPSGSRRDLLLALSIAHLTLIQACHGLLFDRDFGYFNRLPVNRLLTWLRRWYDAPTPRNHPVVPDIRRYLEEPLV